jgi:hypothetical protein
MIDEMHNLNYINQGNGWKLLIVIKIAIHIHTNQYSPMGGSSYVIT